MLHCEACSPCDTSKTAVIFNTDMGIDDAMAILLWKILGTHKPDYMLISPGNTDMRHALQNIAILKKWTGLPFTVVKGEDPDLVSESNKNTFHGVDGFGNIGSAVIAQEGLTEADFAQFIEMPQFKAELTGFDEIVYFSVGPVSTLATLIKDESIRRKIKAAYVMGGGIHEFNCAHETEFNFYKDPASVKAVLASGLPITLFPLDITDTQQISEADIVALQAAGAPAPIAALLRFNLASNKQNHINGAVMHDSVPVLYAAFPEKFTVTEMRIGSDCHGKTFECEGGAPVLVATAVENGLLMDCYRCLFAQK